MMTLAIDTIDADDEIDGPNDSLAFERRRGGGRVRIARPVRVVEPHGGRHLAGRSRDVSASGMRVELPFTNAVEAGDTVSVHVGTLAGAGPLRGHRSTLEARVVWVRRDTRMLRPLVTAGLEFVMGWDARYNVA